MVRFKTAVVKTWDELNASLRGIEDELVKTALALFGLVSFVYGVFFAVQDYGEVNVIASFVAGCITFPLLMAILIVSFFGGAFPVITIFRLSSSDDKYEPGPLFMLLWGVIGLLIFSALFAIALKLPVIGDQIDSILFRDD